MRTLLLPAIALIIAGCTQIQSLGGGSSGNVCAPDGTACNADGNCCSQQCVNGACSSAACSPNGTQCAADAECCSQQCTNGVCAGNPMCSADGDPCNAAAECCSQQCTSGACGGNPACSADGDPCGADADCCSQLCTNGVCGGAGMCAPEGDACASSADCCSQLCTNGVCVAACVPEVCDGVDNDCNGIIDDVTHLDEDFADNSAGWTLDAPWVIGAVAAACGDPDMDTTPSADNGVAGVALNACASFANGGFLYLTSPAFDASGGGAVELHYNRWLQSDYAPYMENRVDVYNGTDWVTVWITSGAPGVKDTSWAPIVFDLTTYKNAQMRVRFGYATPSQGAYSVGSWNIDDIKVVSACP